MPLSQKGGIIIMIYSQIRKRIEQEKRQFQSSLKQIQSINSNAKIYQPYEAKSNQASPKESREIKDQQHKVQTSPRTQYEVQDELINKLRQITEIKREDKMAKITIQFQHLRKKNSLLNSELAQLKQLLQQKDREVGVIESSYREQLSRSAEKESKIQQQETNLKSIIKDLRTHLQKREEDIAILQGEVYELSKQREQMRAHMLKEVQVNKQLKIEISRLQNHVSDIKESITSFVDIVLNKINFFSQPTLTIIRLENEVINKDDLNLFFGQLEAKIKAIQQEKQQKIEEKTALQMQIQTSQKKQSQLLRQLQEIKTNADQKGKELVNKIQSLQNLQLKLQWQLAQNEELKLKQYLINQQLTQKCRQMQEQKVSLIEKQQILQQNLSLAQGQLAISHKNELQKQQKLQHYQQVIQKLKIQREELEYKLKEKSVFSETQIVNFKQQLAKVQLQNQRMLLKRNQQCNLNTQLQQHLQSLTEKLLTKQEQLQKQAQKLRQAEFQEKKLAEQNQRELHQVILLNAELEKYKKECTNYQLNKQQLQTRLKSLQNFNQQTKQDIQKLSNENKLSIQQIRYKDKQIQQLETAIKANIHHASHLTSKLNQQKHQLQLAMLRLSKLQMQLQAKNQLLTCVNEKQNRVLAQKGGLNAIKDKEENSNDNLRENGLMDTQSVYQLVNQIKVQNQTSLKQKQHEYERKIYILVNQIKEKVQQIRSLKTELTDQTQMHQKEKKHIKQTFQILSNGQSLNQKRFFEVQKELYKTNYMRVEAHKLLLETQITQLQHTLTQKHMQINKFAAQNELLKQQIQQKIVQIAKIHQKQEEKLGQSKSYNDLQLKSLFQFISNIKRNCLKNNCDSVGIISITLSKLFSLQYKNLELISSPTDFEMFNKIQEINAIQQFQLQYVQRQAQRKQVQQQLQSSDDEASTKLERKKSEDVNKVSFQSQNMVEISKNAKFKSVELIEQQKQQLQLKSGSKQAFSIQNNPDVPEIVLPYPQLLQRYRDLKSDMQRMQEYICHVHTVNFKIKKGIPESDQHNKHSSLDKLSEKLAILVKLNETFLKNQTQQFTNQIGKIIAQIQSYIHFVDQISKIEPFIHYQSNKNQNKLNKLRRKVTQHIKLQKEGLDKHAYSQGDSREDEFIDHFDGYFCQHDQDFPYIDSERKEILKKQKEGMQRYFQENKQLYSEISSVKDKSLKSHNSFLNSHSQIWPLGAYLKNKQIDEFEQHQHQPIKKQSNDSQRLSQMSIKEIKSRYHKLKQVNKSLNLQKNHLEKHCKKLETQQNNYKNKIAKMTKEFNDSFKFLCQINGKHVSSNQKQRPKVFISNQKQAQVETMVSPKKLKICKLLERDQIIKKPEQQNQERVLQKEKGMKQLQFQNEALKIKIRQLQHKFIETQKANNTKNFYYEQKLKKYQSQFASFVKKSLSKTTVHTQNQQPPQKNMFQRDKAFRKNSNSFKEVEVSISPPKEEPISPTDIYQLLCRLFNFEKNTHLSQKLNSKQFEQVLTKSIDKMKKNVYNQLVSLVLQYLQRLTGKLSQQQCIAQLDKVYTKLTQYLGINQHINQLFMLTKELLPSIKRYNSLQVGNLSINSNCSELKQPVCSEKSVQKHSDNQSSEQQNVNKVAELYRQLDFLHQQNAYLEEELSTFSLKIQEKSRLIEMQSQQNTKSQLKIKKERQNLEIENRRLKQQLETSKLKSKKSKIYHIGY